MKVDSYVMFFLVIFLGISLINLNLLYYHTDKIMYWFLLVCISSFCGLLASKLINIIERRTNKKNGY